MNCAAIPESLFESELFGHERGAFTGALEARAGWFEQASGGTIFLDEIGEMPAILQTKLLRTLQEGTVVRLGGKREIDIDMRLVAATNRDLAAEVARGRFREDLFYRLNVIPITLPPLSERRSDIPDLVLHFLARANQDNQRNVNLTRDAIDHLARRPWPGNIRQLANVLERLVLLAGEGVIDARDLAAMPVDPPMIAAPHAASVGGAIPPHATIVRPYLSADSHGHEQLRSALAQAGGNKTRAAQRLGLTERQFSYRWRKLLAAS